MEDPLHLTFPALFAETIRKHGNRPAMALVGENPITYNELDQRIRAVIAWLEKLGFKQGDLVGGKITLYGDATMSFSTSQYNTNVPYVTSSTTTCTNPTSGPTCGIVPGIVNNLGVIKLGGVYQLDKNSKIGLAYWYQHLYSNDYYYNGYTSGMNPSSVVPTNQSSPSYSVNVISANYTYTFD